METQNVRAVVLLACHIHSEIQLINVLYIYIHRQQIDA